MFAFLKPPAIVGLALLALTVGLISCSDDDLTGPQNSVSPIPLSSGTTFRYQYLENANIDDTCDVVVQAAAAKSPEAWQTRWVFDFHGVLDTVYMHFGNDSAIQYVGIVPPPDTGYVSQEDNRLVFEDFPLFELEDIVIDLPLEHGKTWTPLSENSPFRYNYYATAIVDDYNSVIIGGKTYNAFKITIDVHGTSVDKAWNHLIINAYISPGIGLVAVYNTMYREEYPSGRFLGLIGWELVSGTR